MNDELNKAIAAAGGQVELARKLGVTQQAVSKWATLGYVPLKRAHEIEHVTGVPRRGLLSPLVRSHVDGDAE